MKLLKRQILPGMSVERLGIYKWKDRERRLIYKKCVRGRRSDSGGDSVSKNGLGRTNYKECSSQ
jgi:hypothetical protein